MNNHSPVISTLPVKSYRDAMNNPSSNKQSEEVKQISNTMIKQNINETKTIIQKEDVKTSVKKSNPEWVNVGEKERLKRVERNRRREEKLWLLEEEKLEREKMEKIKAEKAEKIAEKRKQETEEEKKEREERKKAWLERRKLEQEKDPRELYKM